MTEQNILMGENGPQLPVGTHENILRESWQIILGKGDNLLDIHRKGPEADTDVIGVVGQDGSAQF